MLQCWLHGFGDASQRAYCAMVYLVYHQTSGVYSSLLAAKPRVAPVKKLTILRLELTSARILAKPSTTVKNALVSQREIEDVTLWLDSKTALFWIEHRGEWKQFVKNRLKEILALTTKKQWRHCPTYDNPSDIGSRGMKASELEKNNLQWFGPEWLTQHVSEWPKQEKRECTKEVEKESHIHFTAVKTEEEADIHKLIDISKFSNETRLYQVTAWVMRFLINLVTINEDVMRTDSELLTEEVISAQKLWMKCAQNEMVSEPKFDQFKKQLSVLKDGEGIYRCHGRLVNSDLHMDTKQPILLSQHHSLTKLIVESCHKRVLYGGVRETLAELRSKFWIYKGRQLVKKILRGCTTCRRFLAKPFQAMVSGIQSEENPTNCQYWCRFCRACTHKGRERYEEILYHIICMQCHKSDSFRT